MNMSSLPLLPHVKVAWSRLRLAPRREPKLTGYVALLFVVAIAYAISSHAERGWVSILMLTLLYFVPAMVAKVRSHRNFPTILVANTFLGWTVIGWAVLLVMAFAANNDPRRRG